MTSTRSSSFALSFLGPLLLVAGVALGACHQEAPVAPTSSAVDTETSCPSVLTPPTAEAACKPAGRSCSPSRAAECCSKACLCPIGRKCTCG